MTNFSEFGFPYPNQLIMTYIGGSQAHGAKVGETDDTDWYGLYIPPPVKVIGLDAYEHFVTTDIRRGKYTLGEIKAMGQELEAEAKAASDRSPLPETVNRERISEIVTDAYKEMWDW